MVGIFPLGNELESPVFILSAIGVFIALLKGRHKFAIFAAFWAMGMLAAYTIIPYKTPWLAFSFLLPMCIIGGYGINELLSSRYVAAKIIGGLLGLTALVVMTYQSYDLNFVRYDDDSMPYVYAHTRREFSGSSMRSNVMPRKAEKGRRPRSRSSRLITGRWSGI